MPSSAKPAFSATRQDAVLATACRSCTPVQAELVEGVRRREATSARTARRPGRAPPAAPSRTPLAHRSARLISRSATEPTDGSVGLRCPGDRRCRRRRRRCSSAIRRRGVVLGVRQRQRGTTGAASGSVRPRRYTAASSSRHGRSRRPVGLDLRHVQRRRRQLGRPGRVGGQHAVPVLVGDPAVGVPERAPLDALEGEAAAGRHAAGPDVARRRAISSSRRRPELAERVAAGRSPRRPLATPRRRWAGCTP